MTAAPRPCLACGGRLTPSPLPGLLHCSACGFITADVDVSDEELASLYGPDYFHGQEYGDYLSEKEALQRNFSARLATLLRFLESPDRASLFEVGCAYGFFLELAQRHFGHAAGMDVVEAVARHGAEELRVDARAGDFLTAEIGQHDVFCLWDTIEHLRQPDRFVARIAQSITPGGLLAITTGDIGSLTARLRGRHWRLIHPPTHLHYFSRSSMTALLTRHGFRPIHFEHVGVTRSLRAILHGILVLTLKRPSLYQLVGPLVPDRLSLTLNLFDIMFVIAQKEDAP